MRKKKEGEVQEEERKLIGRLDFIHRRRRPHLHRPLLSSFSLPSQLLPL